MVCEEIESFVADGIDFSKLKKKVIPSIFVVATWGSICDTFIIENLVHS